MTTVTTHENAPSVFSSPEPDFAARMAAAEGMSGTREAIIRSALALFAEHGYQGTSLRQLADRVGIEAGSLYNHIPSKADLLADMMIFATEEALTGVTALLESAPTEPAKRLHTAIAAHIAFHCTQREQVIVLDRDLGAVSPARVEAVLAARASYEALFRDILDRGVRSRAFRRHHTSLSAKAILRLGPGTATWFRLGGPASAREVGIFYADMIVRGLEPARR